MTVPQPRPRNTPGCAEITETQTASVSQPVRCVPAQRRGRVTDRLRQDTGGCVAADAAGERFEVEFQVADGTWQRELLSSCHGTRFEEALPARPFRFEKGLQSFAGWWYFTTTGTHIGFESWLERDRRIGPAAAPLRGLPR